jgi:hypothetical protein
MKAEDASGKKLSLTADGALVLSIGEDIDLPVKVWVPIKDIIFYTMDFQGEIKIPRLNITVTWLGTPKPWSTTKIYYLETLDPTGDTNTDFYNTSVVIHPLWFRYDIDTFFQKIADDSPMDGMTEYEAKYVFYKMPPAIYNITVTTVNRDPSEMPYEEQSPGNSKWPGRTDAEVPYEIKIDWKGWSEDYEDTVPEIRTGPKEQVNDRVVLRIFGSMNGVPVTTANFPAWLVDAWNPDLIGIRTALVCKEEIVLKTWAHDFWKRVIDGDLRVGDAEFKISERQWRPHDPLRHRPEDVDRRDPRKQVDCGHKGHLGDNEGQLLHEQHLLERKLQPNRPVLRDKHDIQLQQGRERQLHSGQVLQCISPEHGGRRSSTSR